MDLPLLANDLGNDVYQAFEGFILKTSQVEKLKSTFMEELDLGMKHGLEKSSLQMENTFVPELIDGSESGIFLALDLGGTNFRVLLFELKNGKVVKEAIKYYSVSETLRLGPGIDLFDYLATCFQKLQAFFHEDTAINTKFTISVFTKGIKTNTESTLVC